MFDPSPATPDAILIARVAAGETECFAELVRRYQTPLVRVARSRLGRSDWAEDVVQDTFLAAFRGSASYDPRYSFRTWLWTILLNQCHSHYQRRLRSVPVQPLTEECKTGVAENGAAAGTPLARLLDRERAAQLEELLGRLSLPQADALRLRFFGGLKFHEIADAMQCSLNTAKNRVRAGLTQMAQWMDTTAVEATSRGASQQEPSDL